MFRRFSLLTKGGTFVLAAFLAVSPVAAQSSAQGHVAALGTHPTPAGLRIYPGDKGYYSTMLIENYYRTRASADSTTLPVAVAPPRYREVRPANLNVVVSIGEPETKPVLVDIRGPDGRRRSFPVAGGHAAIQPRTIVVRAGEQLTLRFNGARVELPKKQ